MSDIYFTEDHEWLRLDGEEATVGITDYAQQQLGDVVFVELPHHGVELTQGNEAAVVESVKAASEIYAPASGRVIDVNTALEDNPSLVNEDAMGEGWFFKMTITDPAELGKLMDQAAYDEYLAGLE